MPYNTRRKSLSLPSLGIQLPGSNAARSAAHRSPPTSTTSTPGDVPPTKRIKRSHTLDSVPSPISKSLVSRPRNSSISPPKPRPLSRGGQTTPPPSPPAAEHHAPKIDFDGINDDIVVGTLQQLQSTGNRPHLIKELAAVLITSLSSVESSSNPTAIISSRLTNYLRRPWTALAPCPLTKEQVAVHPRRVYYYLTTCPRQEIPEFAEHPQSAKRIISPSLSSGPDDEEEDVDQYPIKARSPSPEIDLSNADLDFDNTTTIPNLSFSQGSFQPTPIHLPTYSNISDNRRAASPPLEHDEREFTETASTMLERRQSEQIGTLNNSSTVPQDAIATTTVTAVLDRVPELEDDNDEHAAQRNREAAAALFGPSHHLQVVDHASLQPMDFSSPMLRPQSLHLITTPRKAFSVVDCTDEMGMLDATFGWSDLKSPECVDLSELDDLLGAF